MVETIPPSRNPANEDSMPGMVAIMLKKFSQYVDVCLPARVISYDRASNRAQVQPMIKMVSTEDVLTDRGQIASVPVLLIGGGEFFMSFPLKTGDLGWILACDRDISLFKKNYENSPPNTKRMHDFADALFIPDIMTGYSITGEDGNAVLQNLDGSVKISLGANTIKLKATNVEVESTSLTHNGVNIGDTHVHTGVQSGGSNTGAPAT